MFEIGLLLVLSHADAFLRQHSCVPLSELCYKIFMYINHSIFSVDFIFCAVARMDCKLNAKLL